MDWNRLFTTFTPRRHKVQTMRMWNSSRAKRMSLRFSMLKLQLPCISWMPDTASLMRVDMSRALSTRCLFQEFVLRCMIGSRITSTGYSANDMAASVGFR